MEKYLKSCQEVVHAYYQLQAEANELYKEVTEMNAMATKKIIHAMAAIGQGMEFQEQAIYKSEQAEALLMKSACCFECSRDKCECSILKKKFIDLYETKDQIDLDVLENLQASLAALEIAMKFSAKAEQVKKAYDNCLDPMR